MVVMMNVFVKVFALLPTTDRAFPSTWRGFVYPFRLFAYWYVFGRFKILFWRFQNIHIFLELIGLRFFQYLAKWCQYLYGWFFLIIVFIIIVLFTFWVRIFVWVTLRWRRRRLCLSLLLILPTRLRRVTVRRRRGNFTFAKQLCMAHGSPRVGNSWIPLYTLLIRSFESPCPTTTSTINSLIIKRVIVESVPYLFKLLELLVSLSIGAVYTVFLWVASSTNAAINILRIVISWYSKRTLSFPQCRHICISVWNMNICIVFNPGFCLYQFMI